MMAWTLSTNQLVGKRMVAIGRELTRDSKRLVSIANTLATQKDDTKLKLPCYDLAYNSLLRIAILVDAADNLLWQVLFYSIVTSMTSTISVSHTIQSNSAIKSFEEKIKAINDICEAYEMIGRKKIHMHDIINSYSSVLKDEMALYHDTMSNLNGYINALAAQQLYISTSLVAIMIAMVGVIAYITALVIIPSYKYPWIVKYISKYVNIDLINQGANHDSRLQYLTYCIYIQLFIVLLVALCSYIVTTVRRLQRQFMHNVVSDAKNQLVVSKLLILDRKHSQRDEVVNTNKKI